MHHVHHHHLYLPPPNSSAQIPSIPLPPLSPTTPTEPGPPSYAIPTSPSLPRSTLGVGAIGNPAGNILNINNNGAVSAISSAGTPPVLIAPRLLPSTAPLHVLASVSASARSSPLIPIPHATGVRKPLAKRTFACAQCTSSFSERFNLNKHVRAVHERRRPFQCPTCNQRFQQRDHMQKHEACVHKKLRLFTCTACGAAFGWRGVLKKHKRSSACIPKKQPNNVNVNIPLPTTPITPTSTLRSAIGKQASKIEATLPAIPPIPLQMPIPPHPQQTTPPLRNHRNNSDIPL